MRLLLILCLIPALVKSQSIEWEVWKMKVYNYQTKKTKIDSINTGSAYLDLRNKVFSIRFMNQGDFFPFNDSGESIIFDSVFLSYYFKKVSLPEVDKKVLLSYYYDESEDISYGLLTVEDKISSRVYYIIKKDTIESERDFVNGIKDKIENIRYEWIPIEIGSDDSYYFTNSELVSNRGGTIQVWLKQLIKTFKHKNITYKNIEVKMLWSFDCADKKILIEDVIYYNNGKVITSMKGSSYDWRNVIPESIGEILLKNVCQIFKK